VGVDNARNIVLPHMVLYRVLLEGWGPYLEPSSGNRFQRKRGTEKTEENMQWCKKGRSAMIAQHSENQEEKYVGLARTVCTHRI